MAKTTVFVCTSCRYTSEQRAYDGKRGGFHLWQRLLQNNGKRQNIEIKAVECLSACNRYCTVAITAPGKTSLMFGDLPALSSDSAIYELAEMYDQSRDGVVSRDRRPSVLRKGILARIPPV